MVASQFTVRLPGEHLVRRQALVRLRGKSLRRLRLNCKCYRRKTKRPLSRALGIPKLDEISGR
jgi:hypothetical protein